MVHNLEGPVPADPLMRGGSRRLAWASFAAITLGIIRTLSVGAWLGLASAALVLLALKSRRLVAGAMIAMALIAVSAFIVLPAERTLDRFNPATGTGLFRLEIWTSSLHMVADHPLLGVGLDNYLYLYRTEYILPQAWEEPNISHPHNWLLQFWLELGLLGVVTAAASVVWIGYRAHRLFRTPIAPGDRTLAAAALGILVAFLVHGSVDNSYFLVDLATIWWVLMGLLALPTEPAHSDS